MFSLFVRYINFILYLCVLSSKRFLKNRFFICLELLNHFFYVHWNAANSFLAISFDLIFNNELVFSIIFLGIESEHLHRLQINNFLSFSYLDLFCLKSIRSRLKFFNGFKQGNPKVTLGKNITLENQF